MSTDSAGGPSSPHVARLCACGCGEWAKPGNRYLRNHHGRKSLDAYIEENRGYTTPCRTWQRHTDANGYAIATTSAGPRMALHLIYEQERGPVPAGHGLERLCGERACVRLDHARLRPRGELFQRNNAPARTVRQAVICRAGHAMTAENTITAKSGKRRCRTCFNLRQREYYARTKDPDWQAARTERRHGTP